MKIKYLLLTALLLTVAAIGFAQTKKKPSAEIAPDQVVKNLYAAQKKDATNPFIQTKNRALVDKYFAQNLADTIWKTAASDAGYNFDPLYYAQDTQITNFVVGRADENNVVTVKFKNFGKDEEIMFSLVADNTKSKGWKIDAISYSDSENLGDLLEYGMMTEEEKAAAEKADKFSGDYLVGNVKCNFTQNKGGYWARVKCDDQANVQIIDMESLTFGLWKKDEKGRRGNFVLAADGSVGEFVDASGKKTKVTRVR